MRSVPRFLFLLVLLGACQKPVPAPVYQAVPVTRRDIIVTAQASGAINPDTTVQVKSKASGEILDIKVQTGDVVKHGTLIVQVDQRIPANDVAQAQATLQVDSAQLANAKAQYNREKELFAAKAVTQQELEQAQLTVSVANAAAVRDGIALENAKISLGNTQVLAPITGTVIQLAVQRGTVISSPNSSASGGTVILTMADLGLVQVKTWVDETDVGKLHPGQRAEVIVAAYPNRPFKGKVLKVEPQADTIQNVTMFPVDISIDNKEGLLKPGMNADVRIAVGRRLNVLAVPNAALRTEKDVASAGMVLGINPADLQQMLTDAKATFADQLAQKADTGAQAQLPKPGGGRGGRGGDYSFGGRYIVFAQKNGKATPVYIQTGLTDLDYSEVNIGLAEGDSVLLLPSASLVESQQQLQQRIRRFSGLPGQAKPAAPAAGGARATAAPGAGGSRGGKGP